jgi:hypothetical protein
VNPSLPPSSSPGFYIDTARDIYKNATLEQAVLLRLLISREKDTEKFIRGWESRLMVCDFNLPSYYYIVKFPSFQEFQQAVLQLQSASAGISTMNAKAYSRLETDMDYVVIIIPFLLLRLICAIRH